MAESKYNDPGHSISIQSKRFNFQTPSQYLIIQENNGNLSILLFEAFR